MMKADSSFRFPGDDPVRDERILERYLAGECTPGERAAVDAWCEANPDKLALITDLRHVARYPVTPKTMPDSAYIWAAFQDRIHSTSPLLEIVSDSESDVPGAEPLGRSLPTFTGEAAGMAGGATVKKLFGTWPQARSGMHAFRRAAGFGAALGVAILVMGLGILRRSPAPKQAATSVRTIVTPRGQRAEMRLADGSTVILGAGSTLRITEPFGETSRDMYLEGEAYFDVTHDESRPFRVRTARAVTEDVGTRFVITSMAGDTSDRVVVAEGVVSVRSPRAAVAHNTALLLRANDLAELTSSGTARARRNMPIEQYVSWIHGVIRFDSVTLAAAIPMLERQYDIRIHVEDARLMRQRFNGWFTAGQVDAMLKGLAFALDARYASHGKDVTLSAGRSRD